MRPALKAKETSYRGILFRSRLEARVAATFDRHSIAFQYEPEAYQFGDVHYLPDFWLTRARKFVEVKPTWDQIQIEEKAQALASASEFDVFYIFPTSEADPHMLALDGRLRVLGARGEQGRVSSAVWSPCPGCHAVQPWNLGDEGYTRCCDEWFTTEEWWDAHYAPKGFEFVYGLKLPQYRDGQMVWVA